jgi:hypothetical protein
MRTELLVIGGRSGVGKTTAAIALHELLKAAEVKHAVIEGDFLDLAQPAPHEAFPTSRLAERNLAAIWSNYRELGYRRLVFTNTVSVVFAHDLARAMGDEPRITSVLLRGTDSTVEERMSGRVKGATLTADVLWSARRARWLDENTPSEAHRLDTDAFTPGEIASHLRSIVGWGP